MTEARRIGAAVAPVEALLGNRSRVVRLLVGVGALSLWLIGSGYVGLSHDALIYALQIMFELQPDVFADDLFFASGSQDDFTLFAKLGAPLVDSWGLFPFMKVLSTGGALLWFLAVVVLVGRLLPTVSSRRVGLILVLALPPAYGAGEIFEIGRNLATPRVLSEALVLFALGLWSLRYSHHPGRSRVGRSVVFSLGSVAVLGCAALLHPLMALPGVLIVIVEWFIENRRWKLFLCVGLSGGVSIATLGVLKVGPFAGLFETFDDTWRQIVVHRSPHLFLAQWEVSDWARLAFFFSIGFSCLAVLEGWRRRLVLAVIVVAFVGVLANGVGGDLLGSTLLTQLQMFRFVWPMQVVVPLFAGTLVFRGRAQGGDANPRLDRLALLVLLSVATVSLVGVSASQFLFSIASAPLVSWWLARRAQGRDVPSAPRWFGVFGVVAALILCIDFVGEYQGSVIYGIDGIVSFGYTLNLVSVPLCFAVGGCLVWLLATRTSWASVSIVSVLVLGVFTVGLLGFDWRTDTGAAVEGGLGRAELVRALPPGGVVFWQGEPLGSWFLLGRPSYFNLVQGAGVVFNRETAMEYERRALLLGPWAKRFGDAAVGVPGSAEGALERLCRDREDLFSVALGAPLTGIASISQWPPMLTAIEQAPGKVPGGRVFSLYRCRDLLAAYGGL